VPHTLADTRVWVRFHGYELIVTAVGDTGPVEVARHRRSTKGNPSINDEHYPPRRDHYGERNPRASSREEAAFLALGPGAASWLVEAAVVGIRRIRPKMAEAVTLAKLTALSVLISLLWMTLGCFRYRRMPPKVSIAWSTRHMGAARWLLAPTCIRRASTRSCRKRWRRPLLTDCCTMLTWLSPVGIASAWLRPPPAKASNRSNQRSMRRDIQRTQ
jgi:hypothetical protein